MSNRFDELWIDFLEGQTDASSMAELDRIFDSDPELLRRAVFAYQDHRLLGLVMQESAEEFEGFVTDTLNAVRTDSDKYTSKVIDRHRQEVAAQQPEPNSRKSWKGLGIIAALCTVVCLIGLGTFWRAKRQPVQDTTELTTVRHSTNHVATLVRVENCRWRAGPRQALTEGSRLQPGRLQLLEGVVLLRFDAGARVAIKGPAELLIESADSASLIHGEVIVRAEGEAVGFALRTPVSDFVDWGTEFTVSVVPSGATEIHVLEGAVQWQQPGGVDDRLHFIEQGQAFRIDEGNDSQAVAIPLDTAGFDTLVESASRRRGEGRLQVYEGFKYEPPQAIRTQGGFGWNGGWHGVAFDGDEPMRLIRRVSLSGPDKLARSRGGLLDLPAEPIYVYKRRLATPLELNTDGIHYISFLARKRDAAEDGSEHAFRLMWMSSQQSRLNVGFGVRPQGSPFVYSRGGGHSIADWHIDAGETYLFVGKVVTAADAPDQLFLKVFGPGESLDPREPETWNVVGRPTELDEPLDTIAIAFNESGGFQIDEIRIGTTWEAVTPETANDQE